MRCIENKLGIHGSPTCELVYKNAKAELCGRRKFGLIKYVMALTNGARLGIAAHSVGISQMAYNEATAYAVSKKRLASTSPVGENEAISSVLLCVRADRSCEMDAEGPHCEDGRVRYASKTYENLEATRKAGLNGVTMPRRFGGLNFPITAYTAINEMIASADAGFENIWSLQDCIETLYEFGDVDIDGIGRSPLAWARPQPACRQAEG